MTRGNRTWHRKTVDEDSAAAEGRLLRSLTGLINSWNEEVSDALHQLLAQRQGRARVPGNSLEENILDRAGQMPGSSRTELPRSDARAQAKAQGQHERETALGSALERSASATAAAHIQVAVISSAASIQSAAITAIGNVVAHSTQFRPEAMTLLMALASPALPPPVPLPQPPVPAAGVAPLPSSLPRPFRSRSSTPSSDPETIDLREVPAPSSLSSSDVDRPDEASQIRAFETIAENHREERRGKMHVSRTLLRR